MDNLLRNNRKIVKETKCLRRSRKETATTSCHYTITGDVPMYCCKIHNIINFCCSNTIYSPLPSLLFLCSIIKF